MTNLSLRKVLPAAIIIFVIAAVVYQVSHQIPASPGVPTDTQASSTQPTLITPNYKEAINFSASITTEIRTQLNKNLADTQTELAANPLNLQAWLQLGTIYKMGGDYPHAIVAWSYITEVTPNSAAPYSNLADLYMNFVKDYPKAEENYRKVITLKPNTIAAYHDLYTLYRYLYKTNTSAAADIVAEGLRKNPNNAELLQLQEELKK